MSENINFYKEYAQNSSEKKENNSAKYLLNKENIIALTELPNGLSERKKALGWPVELQGSGRIIEGTNNFEVRYPAGDIFLSFAVTLHELGHLRQEEFNSEINKIDKEQQWNRYIEIKEIDAYQRGIERLKNYFPEVLLEIENKFKKYKKEGQLKKFASFEDLYKFLSGTIDINRAINSAPKITDEDKQDELECKALKEFRIEIFFSDIKNSYVGEKINKEWIEKFIIHMAKKISYES